MENRQTDIKFVRFRKVKGRGLEMYSVSKAWLQLEGFPQGRISRG